jgi:hypothetical protein
MHISMVRGGIVLRTKMTLVPVQNRGMFEEPKK